MTTTYDTKRYALADKLKKCVEDARELLDMDIEGYKDFPENYAMEIYAAVLNAYHKI